MRDLKKYRDEHRRRKNNYNNKSHGKYYNYNKHDDYKTNNQHNRINKYRGKGSYGSNYEERNNEIRVKISNLDYTISKNDLMELFSNVCKVVNAWINYDHTDRSNGTAVCVFENINDAQKAIDKYDGSEIEGLSIKMEILHKRNYTYKKKYKSRCPW
ncbi:hypothetical protein PFAG_01369 [Plasmodium falciparum Santa Lucia]|uniref:RNA and export factor binding protein, putative n=14 Tax=Plasmodium falciparum TaxID=5833 RepID=C6KSZ8_PLAF7|nr:RNA and export factor binding protein, putative [Plasmodium falciparum 3D7]ETW19696.1 hypothetical protein PFFVO_01407 [Plasmodium falciparum Vietnam Oak-Knoll (FVO)]ETW44267.1 hypothetical protein PFNF135_01517 [Plasmodium falciparum NF135/5.C10]ETW50514.1 hypothetical protein PFMALIP_01436 [Plasmodium falciparum MaliPS096_E11]ETW62693.1 hypothetical protein PFMC_01428 [Plasmodium falciparum CAMP/Malaysia]EUR75288.1 hypothetical protein PFBG_01411 [Plasmodium falciparum 7G8]EUT89860.1 hyp|eukprot:XP_966143.1 RNA and export factor binding protein, putative [Plasmodium falciparum 3D7]